jgi:uncharacterized protein YrrD
MSVVMQVPLAAFAQIDQETNYIETNIYSYRQTRHWRGAGMVHGLRDLKGGYRCALEGDVGRVTDVYFDDMGWEVRYLVVDTGWLSGRRVLLSRTETQDVTVADLHAEEIIRTGPAVGCSMTQDDADGHLRSARDIVGYQVKGIDGPLGRVVDLLFDLRGWSVRYLRISTGRWWARQHVLVRAGLIEELDWFHRCARVQLNRVDVGARAGAGSLPLQP